MIDLCEPILFGFRPAVRNGEVGLEMLSVRPAISTPDDAPEIGECKHVCAELVFDPANGAFCVQYSSCGQLAVGDFAVVTEEAGVPEAVGTLAAPLRGTICGAVTIWNTTTYCTPFRGRDDDYDVPWLREDCYVEPPDGLDCLYCFDDEDQGVCTIEQTGECPCSPVGAPGLVVAAPPGATIIPEPGFWDITGDDTPFYAGDGATGRVRYQVKPNFAGAVDPFFRDSGLPQTRCEVWLCHIVVTYGAYPSWEIVCNAPLQHLPGEPAPDETTPRPFDFRTIPWKMAGVHVSFDGPRAKCFRYLDQYCMTDGNGSNYWEHLSLGPRLNSLHHLQIDLNARIALDPDAYPHREPECVEIMNDALRQAGELTPVFGLGPDQGHTLHWNHDSDGLNEWTHDGGFLPQPPPDPPSYWPCHNEPKVTRANGEPWVVDVIPAGTDCRWPAWILLHRLRMQLRVSGEPGVDMLFSSEPNLTKLRLLVSLWVMLDLRVRLHSGWQNSSCSVQIANMVDGGCTFGFDPDRYRIVTSGGCSRVPLCIHWHGMRGPAPWAHPSTDVWSDPPCQYSLPMCCNFLIALNGGPEGNGLVIPGETNNADDPEGPQRYGGDAVIGLLDDQQPDQIGCACPGG